MMMSRNFDEPLKSNATETLDAKHEKVNPSPVAKRQVHLTPSQWKDLAMLLSKVDKLFDGNFGHHPHWKVHLEVDLNAQPKHT